MTPYQKGRWAEKRAIVILRLKGYKILAERFKTPMGEIDLIAAKNKRLVLVEVKNRTSRCEALGAISVLQQQRIVQATKAYLSKYPRWLAGEIRFDVIAFWPWRWCHLKNAWNETGEI